MDTKIEPNVGVVIGKLPPEGGGGDLRGLRHARWLDKKGQLAFILAKDPSTEVQDQPVALLDIPRLQRKLILIPKGMFEGANRKDHPLKYGLPFLGEQAQNIFYLTLHLIKRRNSFEILHGFNAGGWVQLLASLVSDLLGKTVVLELGLMSKDGKYPFLTRGFKPLNYIQKKLFSTAEGAVSRSSKLTQSFQELPNTQISLLETYNPVDLHKFRPPKKKEKRILRETNDLPIDCNILTMVGDIKPRKNIQLALRSFKTLYEELSNIHLLLLGSTENQDYLDKLQRYIRNENLREKVTFTGHVSNVDEYLRASDLFLFTSTREGFPNALCEALATGLPSVVVNLHGVYDELLEHKKNALLVKKDHPKQISTAMNKIIMDETFKYKLQKNARATAKNKLAEDKVGQDYLEFYRKLLN